MAAGPLLGARPAPVPFEIADRLRRWVRTHLDLDEDVTVAVTQLRCRDTGCAPVETVLAVHRPGAPLSAVVPLPADEVCVADVQRAFDAVVADVPGRVRG